MINDDHLYLDFNALRTRGWTKSMVARFLGTPDRWEPVDHWLNFTGKRLYFLGRVELAEADVSFEVAFRRSLTRRKINQKQRSLFLRKRAGTRGRVKAWLNTLTDEERKNISIILLAGEQLKTARATGSRTSHKT